MTLCSLLRINLHFKNKDPLLREEISDFIGTLLDSCGGPSGAPWLVYVNYIKDWDGKANELEEMT